MSGNVAPSPMGGNVAPPLPPPIVRCQPLPTWYMQLGRTRPLLLNKTPFPSRTPVAPRPPPPIVRCQPLPTWYMQLGRTRPLLLNKTPFPSRTPPAAFMLPNPPIHWLAPSPAGAAEASSYTNWTYNDEGEEEEEFGFKKQYIDFK